MAFGALDGHDAIASPPPNTQDQLIQYLDSFEPQKYERIKCCEKARSLYCSDCCKLLIPESQRPAGLANLQLPFQLHGVLDDTHTSATGLHSVALLDNKVQLYRCQSRRLTPTSFVENTYLLFPCPESVPLSSLPEGLNLIVMDCKWTRTALRDMSPALSKLPRVHLSSPPEKSHYGKSHNAGPGCVSTIEVLYYSALETSPSQELIHLLWLFSMQ